MLQLNYQKLNAESTVEYLKVNETFRLDQKRQKDFTIQARGNAPLKVSLYKEDGSLYTANNKPAEATGKNPKITVTSLPQGTYYAQAVKAEDELVFSEITGDLHEGYARKISVKQKKFDPTAFYVVPSFEYLVFDMDGDRNNGWSDELRFKTPEPIKFSVYVETDNEEESLDAKQTKRKAYFFKNGRERKNFLVSASVGAIKEQINTRSTSIAGYQFTFDYKCDLYDFWTNDRRQTLVSAANKWSNVIRSSVPSGLIYLKVDASSVGIPHPFPIFAHRENIYITACSSGDIGTVDAIGGVVQATDANNNLVEGIQGIEAAISFITVRKDFVPANQATLEVISLHELGHALGLVGKNKPGIDALTPNATTPTAFTGAKSKAFNGNQDVPISTPGHPGDTMDSVMYRFTNDQKTNLTQLDLNLLADHGYLVRGIN